MARTAGSVAENTAKAIRAESLKLFAQSGYAAVSMRMIADAVGVQVGTLYNHYPNKQALLMDLLTGHMERLLAAWAAEPGADTLEKFARFHIRYHITKPDEVFLSYMELRSLDAENFAELDRLRRRYEAILMDILAEFDLADRKVTAMAILGMLTGATTWYRPDGRLTAQEIEDIYARLVQGCVGAEVREMSHV